MNLQDNIARMELELADMKKQLQSKQIELQYGVWHMTSRGHVEEYMPEIDPLDATNFGLRRTTRVLATEMRDRIVTSSQIEARAREIEPDWVVNWDDSEQDKYCLTFNKSRNKYEYSCYGYLNHIGAPHMSQATAIQLVNELNEGRFVLGYKE